MRDIFQFNIKFFSDIIKKKLFENFFVSGYVKRKKITSKITLFQNITFLSNSSKVVIILIAILCLAHFREIIILSYGFSRPNC